MPNPTYERTATGPATPSPSTRQTDETTTVTDTFNGGGAEDLGHVQLERPCGASRPSTPPHTVVVKTYTRTIPGVAGTCTDYPNTARSRPTAPSDSETVTVCVGSDLDVTKTANLGYQRELLWDIAKSGPGTVFTGPTGRASSGAWSATRSTSPRTA